MTSSFSRSRGLVPCALFLGALSVASSAQAAFDCSSNNPADWPPPSRPYFMLAVDTSGSMTSCTDRTAGHFGNDSCQTAAVANSCGMEPTRINDAKCAVRKTVQAFAGEVNFGMMTYAHVLSGCTAGAVPDSCSGANTNGCTNCARNCGGEHYAGNSCAISDFANNVVNPGCGNRPDCATANALLYQGQTIDGASTPPVLGGGNVILPGDGWQNGGNVVVDMLKDPTWNPALQPVTNTGSLLEWVDGRTDNSHEIFADGYTPLEGILRSAHQYYSAGWASGWTNGNYCAAGGPAIDHGSPMDPANDRICRSLNVILVTDGDETCNGTPANAAAAMAKVGVVIQGVRVPIKTYVIGFAGATQANLDAIAAAGTTTASYSANNEVQLAQALAGIIAGAVSPEVCDNTDNNCNGCTDEGSKKYCNRSRTGSAAPTAGQCCTAARATCLANFAASITAAKPQGDPFWLPCWDPVTSGTNPETKWLCTDPGEICDNKDNNCNVQIDPAKPDFATNTIDELQLKCGSPAHCPVPEVCPPLPAAPNGLDDNCDGVVDNANGSGVPGSICPGSCVATPELCNGCDDDCDGIADNGVPDVPCGFSPPAACAGVSKCTAVPVAVRGGCIAGVTPPGTNQYGVCGAKGTTETCNGLDDNCDGIVDNNPTGAGAACTPNVGDPTTGACKAGTRVCENGAFVCVGYIGPSPEVCDGIDNDCDGLIDAADPDMPPLGLVCGSTTGRCTKGKTACVGGAIICQGGNLPVPEVCNGFDDDCNGAIDDGLTDAPLDPGCWNNPISATCTTQCAAVGLKWCPPPGATCTDAGTLVGVCTAGTLVCEGKWVCRNDQGPATEVCNNLDDDCNGQVDEVAKLGPPIGDVCGQTVPNTPCKAGINKCVNGAMICDGQVAGKAEECNGLDDDCDGRIDNGITIGKNCDVPYDKKLYPGTRQGGECKPGQTQCDTTTGTQGSCVGGKGPSPEVCDGLDNDCDGQIDESGTAPDGINGSVDPQDPTKHLGDSCGPSGGECKPGHLNCLAGQVVCIGASGAQPEICDCLDNDCDGLIDEDPTPTEPSLCSTGKTCVQKASGGSCQCAAPCTGREFPCPGGQTCETDTVRSGTSTPEDKRFCMRPDACGDCGTQSVKQSDGTILCAPSGTDPATGRTYPKCECKGGVSCHEPCFDAPTCPTGQACAPRDGTCQSQTNCNFFGCPAGQACSANRACVDNKCATDPCPADQVCKPTGDFSSRNCVASCAGVTCNAGDACVDGACKPTGCGTDCTGGTVCHPATGDSGTGACAPSLCTPTSCQQGEYCDPATGSCGADPCEGVVCPSGQVCKTGECVLPSKPPAGTDGGSQVDGATAAGGSGSGAGGKTGGGATSGTSVKSAFGLATGGGGCACSVPARRSGPPVQGVLVGLGLLFAFRTRRRSRRGARGGGK